MKSVISLFKPSRSPFYYVEYIDENGLKRQRSTGYKERREALRSLSDVKSLTREKHKPVLFSKFGEQFLAANADTLSPGSLILYENAFKRFKLISDLPLNRINPREWDLYKAMRLKAVSAVTVNKELRTLKAAMFTAVRWRLIDDNPFSKQPLCRVAEVDAEFVSIAQLQSILLNIKNRVIHDIVAIAFHTGMRAGEIVSLKWSNVDLVACEISVRNDANFKTKTGKRRTIPMNAEVLAIFERRNKQRVGEEDMLFPRMRCGFASRVFKAAARKVLGQETRVHFHSLRHSFCTNLLRGGANVKIVQGLAGHGSITTTEKYLHSVTVDARNAVELLSRY